MGCDMMVALGPATVDGQTIFGINCDRSTSCEHLLSQVPGRAFSPGEKVRTQFLLIPEARQTYSVIASQPEGWWGYGYGANEHGVVVGATVLRTLLHCAEPGLTGGDLVRLTLERSSSARQAVETLTALVERHGQTASPGQTGPYGSDHGFLIADPAEAFAIETAGRHWVYQELHELRASSNASVIHQDWDAISRGLAGNAIESGWWPGDGRKLDYADALSRDPTGQASGLRRWGRATSLLEQQNGHIDLSILRRLLADHYEGTHYEIDPMNSSSGPVPLCQHGREGTSTRSSFIVQLCADHTHLPVLWCAFGPPCLSVYLPMFLEGDIPSALANAPAGTGLGHRLLAFLETLPAAPRRLNAARSAFADLQARLDREVEEFVSEGAVLRRGGDLKKLGYLASTFMQHAVERLDLTLDELEHNKSSAVTSERGVVWSDR